MNQGILLTQASKVLLLESLAAQKKAYLLVGPPGTGKETVALWIQKRFFNRPVQKLKFTRSDFRHTPPPGLRFQANGRMVLPWPEDPGILQAWNDAAILFFENWPLRKDQLSPAWDEWVSELKRFKPIVLKFHSLTDSAVDFDHLLEETKRELSAAVPEYTGITFAKSAIESLKNRAWKANLRELRNALESILMVAHAKNTREIDREFLTQEKSVFKNELGLSKPEFREEGLAKLISFYPEIKKPT